MCLKEKEKVDAFPCGSALPSAGGPGHQAQAPFGPRRRR